MRFPCAPLSLLATILYSTHIAHTSPLPYELITEQSTYTLAPRQYSATACGYSSQLTCYNGQACYTVAGEASCGAAAATAAVATVAGQWQYITITYVETETETMTMVTTSSTFIPAATSVYVQPSVQTQVIVTTVQAPAPVQTYASCPTNLACGDICCDSYQFCAVLNQCSPLGAGSTPNNVISTSYYVVQSTNSAFIRPTSNSITTVTGTATTTVPFIAPEATDGSSLTGITATQQSTGLSSGAIAGIVIGVLLLLFILFLICACCLCKGLIDTLLGCFGLGKKSRRRVTDTTVVEEHHSRHSGRVQGGGRTWYGTRINNQPQKKNSSGWGGALGVGAALATLAVLLGLRRRNKKEEKSEYTGSSYSYSYTTSESSASSDRRTRDSRRDRDSRRAPSRRSHPQLPAQLLRIAFLLLGDSTASTSMPPLRPLPLLSPLPTLSARTPSILSTHSHPSSHPSSISSASLLSSRSFTKSSSRAADTPHESHYDPPSGWLFGVPPGEKYKKEGWEGIWVWGFWGSLGLATVAYAYKPDSS
ncbi:hypothetical protein MMC13_004309 [Lambiella insularis]|nr:hypothetical protein [Lambiella insularis]